MMDRYSDRAVILTVTVAALIAIMLVVVLVQLWQGHSCKETASAMNTYSYFSTSTGCLIQAKNGSYFPLSSLKVTTCSN